MGFDRFFGFNLQQRKTLEGLGIGTDEASSTATSAGTVRQATAQNPAAAADVAALKTQFDALLARLKAAGQMAS